ncbi:hypothetical protein GOP47_0017153, partial [Adiantum capillus-veneris]
ADQPLPLPLSLSWSMQRPRSSTQPTISIYLSLSLSLSLSHAVTHPLRLSLSFSLNLSYGQAEYQLRGTDSQLLACELRDRVSEPSPPTPSTLCMKREGPWWSTIQSCKNDVPCTPTCQCAQVHHQRVVQPTLLPVLFYQLLLVLRIRMTRWATGADLILP